MTKRLRILGIRGVPAAHGGFETFAEHLALHLVEHGWQVTVYCQQDGAGPLHEDDWQGVHRVHIPVEAEGPKGTIVFDWKATLHAARAGELCLTLGYNTAVFCAWLRLKGVPNLINMDGIEWARDKWSGVAKTWFWLNDWAGCWLGNHLIADHPEIKRHLSTRVRPEKITTIAYGADQIEHADPAMLKPYGLEPGRYLSVIARPEPENSLLEIVQGFSAQRRGVQLAVLGRYDPTVPFHKAVMDAASDEVRFLGAIYDKPVVQAIRQHSIAYVHGHRVGGTNPSLVEALGAGNAVIAHDNKFNRWVAGEGALYFRNAVQFGLILDELAKSKDALQAMRISSLQRFHNGLTWPQVLKEYEDILEKWLP